MNNPTPPPICVWIIPIFFPVFWCFVCWTLSHVSGWQKLAAVYPARTPPTGQKFITSARLGRASYTGSLYIYVSREGLYLSVMWFFSMGHKPLFIPWSEINNRQPRKIFFREIVEFDIGNPPINTMQLPKKIFDCEHHD